AVPAGFGPLADLMHKAHAQGIQVPAWIIMTAIWNSPVPPADAATPSPPTARTGVDGTSG
ncbi:hypothetical protein ACFO7E_34260, partial [Cupriavidus pampae]